MKKIEIKNRVMDSSCVIIVLYKPSAEHIQHAHNIAKFANVIAIDNSDTSLSDESFNFAYFSLLSNMGIAYAQNYGIQKAIERDYHYIIFLDQDSVIDENYIDNIIYQYNYIKMIDKKIAALGPTIINNKDGVPYKSSLGKKDFGIVDTIISSGTVVESSIFQKVGLFEEDLFIDVVDHEWCWRCKQKGYNVYMTKKIEMRHEVGTKLVQIFSIQLILSSPFRYYYKYRNSLWMLLRSYVPLKWKCKKTIWLIIYLFVFAIWYVISKSKREYFTYSIKGIKYALFLRNLNNIR